eukprot:5428708-Prorocentrum_lima.AAC.1
MATFNTTTLQDKGSKPTQATQETAVAKMIIRRMKEESMYILAIQETRYKEDMEMEVEGYKVITTAAFKGTHGVAMIIQK